MTTRTALRIAAALATTLLLSAAQAQSFRTYLSIDGNDANPCTLTAPCRLLPAAIAAVAPNGEIWMLDSANYNTGPVSVNKSVTILAVPGALGSVVALGGNALELATPGLYITLRNLNIVPFPGNENRIGVNVTGAVSLLVQACNFTGFATGMGVRSTGFTRIVAIVDSVFRNNGTGAIFAEGAIGSVSGSHFSENGVAVHVLATTAQTSRVTVSRSVATRGQYGFLAEAYTSASARTELAVIASQVDLNTQWGVAAFSDPGVGVSLVSVADSQLSHNNVAVNAANSGAHVYARNNTVTHNSTGFNNGGATFETGGNNGVRDNTANTGGTITVQPGV